MNSHPTNLSRKTFDLAASAMALLALVLFATVIANSQQLQKGINVKMAPTTNALPMPSADSLNAWIVTVTADGRLWFGTNAVTRDDLIAEMIRTPRNRDQNLYVKADGRAPYAAVASALKAAQTAKFDAPLLLTAQTVSTPPGTMIPPQGLQVWLGSESVSDGSSVLIELLSAKPGSPALRINGHTISGDDLKTTMEQLFRGRTEKIALLRTDGAVPFSLVAHIIDACQSAGAKVVLPTPQI